MLGGDLYIARGHLAPNADFMNYAWQDATFTFIDVAPQWQSFNAGNWLDVENGIRYLAEYYYGTLQVSRSTILYNGKISFSPSGLDWNSGDPAVRRRRWKYGRHLFRKDILFLNDVKKNIL